MLFLPNRWRMVSIHWSSLSAFSIFSMFINKSTCRGGSCGTKLIAWIVTERIGFFQSYLFSKRAKAAFAISIGDCVGISNAVCHCFEKSVLSHMWMATPSAHFLWTRSLCPMSCVNLRKTGHTCSSFFYRITDCDRILLQNRIEHIFNRRIKVVHIAMQYWSAQLNHLISWKFCETSWQTKVSCCIIWTRQKCRCCDSNYSTTPMSCQ